MQTQTVHKLFSLWLVLVLVMGILVCNIYITGCGGDEVDIQENMPVIFVAASPPSGAAIAENTICQQFSKQGTYHALY